MCSIHCKTSSGRRVGRSTHRSTDFKISKPTGKYVNIDRNIRFSCKTRFRMVSWGRRFMEFYGYFMDIWYILISAIGKAVALQLPSGFPRAPRRVGTRLPRIHAAGIELLGVREKPPSHWETPSSGMPFIFTCSDCRKMTYWTWCCYGNREYVNLLVFVEFYDLASCHHYLINKRLA